MNKQELKQLLMAMRNGKNDAIINGVLGKIDLIDEKTLKKLIEEKGGTPEAIMAYFAEKITKQQEIEDKQRAIEEEQKREAEAQRLLEQQERDRELREKQARDVTYDYDLNRKLEQLVRGLKQKTEQEREGDLTLATKFFQDIPDDKLPQVLEFLKDELGFEIKANEHGSIEQEGREITEETVTKEQLENGEVKLSISKERLQSERFKELLDDKELELDEKAAEVERTSEETEPEQETERDTEDDGHDDR